MLTTGPSEIRLELPHFSGTLAEVSSALRCGTLPPTDVPLLALTARTLERFHALRARDPEAASEALPLMASVVAWKVRALLPPPEPSLDEESALEDEAWDEVARSVERLAELERVVAFLSERREGRALIVAAQPASIDLPRREPSQKARAKGLSRLLEAARGAVREVRLEALAIERLTLQDALHALSAFARRLKAFRFSSVTVSGWGERTVYFAALLEGVRSGQFRAEQTETHGEIEVEVLEGGGDEVKDKNVWASGSLPSTV